VYIPFLLRCRDHNTIPRFLQFRHHIDSDRLPTANVVPSPPILVTLMMEAIRSSETSVLTRATRRNFPEDDILYFPQLLNAHNVGDVRQTEIHTAEPLVPGPSRLEVETVI
jgi:hypothetical protein